MITATAAVLCTVIRRDQFDARLARAARDAGLLIVEDCRVLDVEADGSGVYWFTAPAAISKPRRWLGADGSGSRVRDDCLAGVRIGLAAP